MNISRGDGSNLNPDVTQYNCPLCTRPDHDEKEMVYCEDCQRWFHFSCAGVEASVKDDENWRCSACRGEDPAGGDSEDDDVVSIEESIEDQAKARKSKNSAKSTSEDDKEIAEAMEAIKKGKKRLKRKMDQKLALAKAKLELANEEMEMQWALDKQILEMKIVSEKKFQKKKEMDKKQLQKELEELSESRKRTEMEVEKLEKKKKRDCLKEKESGEKLPVTSTPIVDPKPSTSRDGLKKKITKIEPILVVKQPAMEEKKKCDSENANSKMSSQDEQSSDSSEDSSRGSSEEDQKNKDRKKSKQKMKQDEVNPTKAQISARQFLSRKLPTFTGRHEEWPIFLSSFNTTTKACGFSNLENLARLQESLRGPARDSVCSRLLLPEAVPQIIETLRMLVWDAAAAVEGVSLNSKLLKGPDFLTSLPSVVCKFRQYSIGFGGDIREMFHQLMIRPEDRQALRFMFDGEIYVMDCAIFGATCSPSQALYVKDRNASEFLKQFPDAVSAIVNRHYVDDYFDSTETVKEAVKRASEVKYIHSRGGFEIRNWVSNSHAVLQQLDESKTNQMVYFNTDKATGSERVLGIVWDPQEDVFTFALKLRENLQPCLTGDKRPTKRIVLSIVMSLFDPLGLLTMFVIHGKMLIQDLWRTGCEWDDTVDDESFEKWKRWTALLPDIERLRIPRHYFGAGEFLDYESLQLHVFVDASAGAYGCVAYFRLLVDGIPRCTLVQAKSKVAPLRQYSIPRLELMAAVMGAKLAETVKANHSFCINRVQFWTDSSTVYSWIVSDHRKYKVFVAYRIGEILSKTNPANWRWICTKLNIADDLTKWKNGNKIESHSPWFTGPKYLYEAENMWPYPEPPRPNVTEELRVSALFHSVEIADSLIDCSRISKWNIIVRTVANVVRFVSNIRRKQQGLPIESLPVDRRIARLGRGSVAAVKRPLSTEEYQEAERLLWKMAQVESFPDEVKTLVKCREGKRISIDRSSNIFKLSPVLDEHNVMRMDGRVQEGEFIPFELQFPVILPKGHPVTVRLIEYYHNLFGHGNRETVVNELRQRFYIPRVRRELEKIGKNCMQCRVRKCKPVVPRMAPLPNQRTTPYVRPFSYVGVDFFGPINVVVGRHTEKRWCALFTCFGTRAIHLEVVHSLSSQACLMAIRRFVCRRGVPVEFFSDNGTNFVGASKEIMKEIKSDCSEELTSSRTRWNFNPPSAPHFGGVWERLVRSVKETMDVLDDGRRLTDEILQTTLTEAEDIVNSRPLTYVPQDPENSGAITPNHFLRGQPSSGTECRRLSTNDAEALKNSYKRSQLLADRIWKRWLTEYLPFINRRVKWHTEQKPLEVGEVVFVADEDNRKCWVRAIVEEVILGVDGRIRQAVVRTAKGTYKRPVAKLAVPEIRIGKSDKDPSPVLR
ncbi:uncharacterized protein LOC129767049 [Toxorhynchites rutilus septentrionalis]|uniref:uncharacterized protein LOC129767049 n=1 Tax=Toxorhynchites rutilus septentrionalis TaxID=329112 RepID=UPI00247B228D|nr:uncharacterized protein LOC129767049 [Toxorhynchites rutilus septentrionalis]